MNFLDEAIITVRSGDGGKGCVSFRREKYIPRGGPDGGDGGDGGNITLRGTKALFLLTDYSSRKHFKAGDGKPGKGKNQSGKYGEDLILKVPLGTVVQDIDTNEILADIVRDNQEILLIHGGRGGKGNQHFATSTNRVPRFAQPGLPGQERKIRLSLKLLADIGLIGLPNAGKSTLLSRLSTARPKVGAYPFTTIVPNLGVMTLQDGKLLIIADIPGIIEGASQGRGLGHRFLKHIERTNLLLHLLSITYKPENDILEDFFMLKREMEAYSPALALKPQIAIINKMDLYSKENRDLAELQDALRGIGVESLPVSALTGEGIEELKEIILKKLDENE
ncbi:MAG: GTPase ObgE [Deltaproteobacteria bacterium]|nr:GTPase ObgE [Deltaproteobacteria bacterium]